MEDVTATPRYVRTVSCNNRVYWKAPTEVYTATSKRYYETSKNKIIRQKILKQIDLNGRIPTQASICKYMITSSEMMAGFEVFRTNCEDTERKALVQEKLFNRIKQEWKSS